jgi:hypothetical protein
MRWVYGKQSTRSMVTMGEHCGVALTDASAAAAQAELDARVRALTAHPKWLEPAEVEAVICNIAARPD